MTTPAKIADQCLWTKHIEKGPLRLALESLEPDAVIRMLVDGELVQFRKMSRGSDGRDTPGLVAVGDTATIWRNRYKPNEHIDIFLDFAGASDG